MKAIAKLKDRARKHEQKEDWEAAIDAYQQIIEAEEGADSIEVELTLYNRIGDLYLRLGRTDDAVASYETAADKYAEAGFFNNAIALCNKALRHRPDRPETYLTLSRLCAEQGFIPDARRWIVDYAERQVKRGAVEAAINGLSDFADQSGDPDVRELLAQHLAGHDRSDEAIDQLRSAYVTRIERGETEAAGRAAALAARIDPAVDLKSEAAPAARPARAAPSYDAEADAEGYGAPLPGLAGLETHRADDPPAAASDAGLGIETFETGGAGAEPEPADEEAEPLPMLDTGFDDEDAEETEPLPMLDAADAADTADADSAEPGSEQEQEPEPVGADDGFGAPPGLEEEPAAGAAEGLPGLDLGAGFDDAGDADDTEPAPEPALADGGGGLGLDFGAGFDLGLGAEGVDEEEAGDPGDDVDVDAVIEQARSMVSRGLTGEALRELRVVAGSRAGAETFSQALAIANEIVRHNANDLDALQARAAFAARLGDRSVLVDTYIDLAEGLSRAGAEVKAAAIYQRALEIDPANELAREALGVTSEEDEAVVDLDAILREMAPEAGVAAAPTQETDDGLAAMLSSFKARVTDQPSSDDAGDHYDLGLAFKEMGLIDEAIAEFQTALTGGEERLKVYEELGQCFIQKGQLNVAIKVLNRAIQAPRQSEADLLGVYYHLGHCHEELGQRAEAREMYEKVLAIDPAFEDVPVRVARL